MSLAIDGPPTGGIEELERLLIATGWCSGKGDAPGPYDLRMFLHGPGWDVQVYYGHPDGLAIVAANDARGDEIVQDTQKVHNWTPATLAACANAAVAALATEAVSLTIDGPPTPGAVLDSVKCMRLPGLVLMLTCPECGHRRRVNLGKENMLEYPTIGAPFDMGFGCYECDHEWSERVQLDVSFRVLEVL